MSLDIYFRKDIKNIITALEGNRAQGQSINYKQIAAVVSNDAQREELLASLDLYQSGYTDALLAVAEAFGCINHQQT